VYRAAHEPDHVVYTWLDDKGQEAGTLTCAKLYGLACAVAQALMRRGVSKGDRVLLVFGPGLDFVAAFFGCALAGAVSVPVYPPHPSKLKKDLKSLAYGVSSTSARLALTSGSTRARRSSWLSRARCSPSSGPRA
jgi:acyl-CoA synthetase (AMP-forming)/AMP-acid ligase II